MEMMSEIDAFSAGLDGENWLHCFETRPKFTTSGHDAKRHSAQSLNR